MSGLDVKKLIVNNDGHGGFFDGRYTSREAIERELEIYVGTYVSIFEWCVTIGGKANYPSKVTEVIGEDVRVFPRRGDRRVAELLEGLISSGIDPLRLVIDKCHEIKLDVYPSIRMNPDYDPKWMGEAFARMYNSRFWWENPHLRVRDRRGRLQIKLSYAFPEVRRFKLNIIGELLKYDVDGINLDFLRHPPFLGYEDPLIEDFKREYGVSPLKLPEDDMRWLKFRARVMTCFMRDVRAMLDRAGEDRGRKLRISVRVDHRDYLRQGLDIQEWVRKGLIDHLIVSEHGLGGFTFPLKPFRRITESSGCELYFGEEAICSGHDLTPEEDRLLAEGKISEKDLHRRRLSLKEYCQRALKWYSEGADGIHIFNDPNNRDAFLILGDIDKIKAYLKNEQKCASTSTSRN